MRPTTPWGRLSQPDTPTLREGGSAPQFVSVLEGPHFAFHNLVVPSDAHRERARFDSGRRSGYVCHHGYRD